MQEPFRMIGHSLQTRILAFFLLLMIAVQVGGFVLINTVGITAARKTVGDELVGGARVIDLLLDQDAQRLVQGARLLSADYAFRGRSEEHTSELQSHVNLVCRLLLEKKKKKKNKK